MVDTVMKQTVMVAKDTMNTLNNVSIIMIVGLILAIIIGISMAIFIILGITRPINSVIGGLTEASEQMEAQALSLRDLWLI